jgi:hypothetical protein
MPPRTSSEARGHFSRLVTTRRIEGGVNISVVITSLKKINPPFAYPVNQPVFLRNPPRPAPCQHILQRLRFANSSKRIAQDGLNQFDGAQSNLAISRNPVAKILAELGMEYRFPISVARQVQSPDEVFPTAPASPSAVLHVAEQSVTAAHSWVSAKDAPSLSGQTTRLRGP